MRSSRRSRVDHASAAARLRSKPGVWLEVAEYRTRATANQVAHVVRTGRWNARQAAPYTAGDFEARTEMTEFGIRLLARYVACATEPVR